MEFLIDEMAEYMKRHKMTQTAFAQALGVSPSAVCYWFSGHRKPNTKNYIAFNNLLQEEKQNGIDRPFSTTGKNIV